MSVSPLQEILTNELSLKRFSLVFNQVIGLPETIYKLEEYDERTIMDVSLVFLTFRANPSLKVIVEMSGPIVDGCEFDWGLNLDPEEGFIEKIGKERVVVLRGYLRPVA